MAFIGRGTLPQNFLDSVSPGMRLPTPEPMYWFARAALAGRMQFSAINAGMQTVQQFVSMAGGGAPVDAALDSFIRSADAYPNAVLAVDDFGKGAGDTIKLRRDVFANSTYTKASRRVAADNPTSTVGQAVQMDEVPLVLEEYEGPYSQANAVVQPYVIREFDAKYRANKDQLAAITTRNMVRDYIKWLDTVIRDEFRSTTNITYADDVANVLSMTLGAGHSASLDMILKTKKALSDREWPRFSNGKYICLVPTMFNVEMVGDPDYRTLSAQQGAGAGRNQLFAYIASIQDVDIFECSTLKTYTSADGAVPGDTNTVPAGASVFEGLIFGPGAVGMGTAQNPEARFADDTDYGKNAKVIWNAKQAFGAVDVRGVQRFLFQ